MSKLKSCKDCGKPFYPTPFDMCRCIGCHNKVRRKYIKEAISDGYEVDTSDNEYIICPYCGEGIKASDHSYEDLPEAYKDGEYRITCPECNEDFTLVTEITFNFDTRRGR